MFKKENGIWKPVFPTFPLGTAFSVGEWNINPGGGRFTPAIRDPLTIAAKARLIKAAGGTHMEFHDTEALPKDAPGIKKVVTEEGLGIYMATANLFKRPEFVNGNFGSRDASVRKAAIRYTKEYLTVAIEVYDAVVYVYWNGSNGFNIPLSTDYKGLYRRTADCLTEIVDWQLTQYGERAIPIAIEPKPNEPPSYGIPADAGEVLAIRGMMPAEFQPAVGSNPEKCHEALAGKRFAVSCGLLSAAGALYYVHLNGGSGLKFDEDRAFGDVDPSEAAEIVYTLDEIGYNGAVGLDVQPLPTDRNDQQAASVERSIRNFKRGLIVRGRVNRQELEQLRDTGDAAGVADLWSRAVMGVD